MKSSLNRNHARKIHRSRRRGIAAVEFAIVAPVLVLLVFGIIEVGRMLMVQQILTNASREGARQAVVWNRVPTDIDATVSEYLQKTSITEAIVDVNPADLSTLHFGDPVTVGVSVPFEKVSWLPSAFLFGGQTLSAETVMRAETP